VQKRFTLNGGLVLDFRGKNEKLHTLAATMKLDELREELKRSLTKEVRLSLIPSQ
jgi:hypothetical protein